MKKILLVEDDPALSSTLGDTLVQEGFEVVRAKDGEEGLTNALGGHPDMILLDIILPKMNGLMLLGKLREDPWGKTVPVIILSNLGEPTMVAAAIDNVNDYLVKVDWKIEDVVKKIKAKLNL